MKMYTSIITPGTYIDADVPDAAVLDLIVEYSTGEWPTDPDGFDLYRRASAAARLEGHARRLTNRLPDATRYACETALGIHDDHTADPTDPDACTACAVMSERALLTALG